MTKPKRSKSRNKSRGNRKFSIKSGNFSKKNMNKIHFKMKEIRNKKTDAIKNELKNEGIKVSGKSNRLLRDIYLYSKLSNINIQHEK